MPRNQESIEDPKLGSTSSGRRDVDDRADREPDDPDERRIGTSHSTRSVAEDDDQPIGRAHPTRDEELEEQLDESDIFVQRSTMSSARREEEVEEELDDDDIIEELDVDEIQGAERDDY